MARNKQISRIYNLLIILEFAPHGLTVRSLCNRLNSRGHEVGVRTVYRDLLALQSAGFPVSEQGTDADNATRWVLGRRSKITQVAQITAAEMHVLATVLGNMMQTGSNTSEIDARALARKIVTHLNIPKVMLPTHLVEISQ